MKKKVDSQTVPVAERALLGRVNRALAKDDKLMKKCRSDSRWYNDFGDYYIVMVDSNTVSDKHADLEGWAKELGVLKPYEHLATE